MPGQFKHLVKYFSENKSNKVVFITKPRKHINYDNVVKIEYNSEKENEANLGPFLTEFSKGISRAQIVFKICKDLKEKGFIPDVIYAHSGWGDGLFLKDIFPEVPLINFMEFYYRAEGADVDFNKEVKRPIEDNTRLRIKNSINLFNLEQCNLGISPTNWQKSLHPKEFWPKIEVVHDGIDVEICKPEKINNLILTDGKILNSEDEIITYIARNLEPYRGFDVFMKAVEIIQQRRPRAKFIIVGGDGVSYGSKPKNFKNYKEKMLSELNLNLNNISFLGYIPYEEMIKIMQISGVHIYLTYPFVLSWSMMEAMSCGCAMICSETAPVKEVVTHNENGLLVDFFSPDKIADAVDEIFNNPEKTLLLRNNARKTIIENYDIKKMLPKQISLIENLIKSKN
jgi:glycosyltransferase involved in cell wall biosynthesis